MSLMPRRLLAQQGSDAKIPAEDFRLALSALLAPATAANAARSGIIRGSGSAGFTACQVLSPSANTFTIKQGTFVVQQATANGGAYIGIVDSDQTRTLTAVPGAGTYKAGYLIAHCYDEAYGDTQDGYDLEIIVGTQNAVLASAAYPTVPPNALVLTGFTVDSSGTVTFTTAPQYTGTHNGILPVLAGDTTPGIFDGQWRDEPARGFQRWSPTAAAWQRPQSYYWGSGTTWPPYAQPGDTYLRTDAGLPTPWLFRYLGSGWQVDGDYSVANLTVRNNLPAALLYAGLSVLVTSQGQQHTYDGTVWHGSTSISYPSPTWVAANGGVLDSSMSPVTLAQVGWADPGWPYAIAASASLEAGVANSSTRWDLSLNLVGGPELKRNRPEGYFAGYLDLDLPPIATYTGAQTLQLRANYIVGSTITPTAFFHYLMVTLIPV